MIDANHKKHLYQCMKRALLQSIAMGLLLASPAFAKEPQAPVKKPAVVKEAPAKKAAAPDKKSPAPAQETQAVAQAIPSHWIEELTWPQVRQLIDAGYRTAIIPTGGTEQNGPHIATGKHNAIVHYTADAIAKQLGNALITPVIAYVPEGRISPPEDHMLFAGTLSVSDPTFQAVLEDTARSLQTHGFKYIFFIGDHGGSIGSQEFVAKKLSQEWAAQKITVASISDYYSNNGQEAWVASLDKGIADPNAHAGFADSSEIQVAAPALYHADQREPFKAELFGKTGVKGDPSQASAEYGQGLLQLKINAAVKQIRALSKAP